MSIGADMSAERRDWGTLATAEGTGAHDATWVLAFFATFAAVTVAWFVRTLDINFVGMAWVVFAATVSFLGLAHVAAVLTDWRARVAAYTLLQLAGASFLGVIWLMVGGMQTPAFLVVFVLPVIASGMMLKRWQPFATAGICVAVVTTAALVASPPLRWYLIQVGVPMPGVFEQLARVLPVATPFPGVDLQPRYGLAVLGFFAFFLVGTALATEFLVSTLTNLYQRIRITAQVAEEAETLAVTVIRSSRDPAVLLFRDTCQIAQVSDTFREAFMLQEEDLFNRDLFSVVQFSYPEVVRNIMGGGELPFAVYRINGEPHMARLSAYPLRHNNEDYVHLTLRDSSDLYYLNSAFDAVDGPCVLIGANRRIAYFNDAARETFPDVYRGADARIVLEANDTVEGWWDVGPRARHQRQVQVNGVPFEVTLVAAEIPGEPGRMSVVTMHAAAVWS